MSEQEWEVAGEGQSRTVGWRSVAAGVGLFFAGVLAGATLLGDAGETPCYEVEERAQPARDVLSSTFGGGEEGRQAMRDLFGLAQEHPGCFDPAYVELLEGELQSPDEPETVEPTVMPTTGAAPTN